MRKKNKLYTANKWNQGLFAEGVDRVNNNIFDIAGSLNKATEKMGSWFGADKLGKTASTLIGGAGSAISGVAGGLIGGDYHSGVGDFASKAAPAIGTALSAVNPILGAVAGTGLGLLGGAYNRLLGTSVDQARLQAAESSIDALNSYNGNVGSLDELGEIAGAASTEGIFKNGLIGGDAGSQKEALDRRVNSAMNFALGSRANGASNLINDLLNNNLRTYRAFGGPVVTLPRKMGSGGDTNEESAAHRLARGWYDATIGGLTGLGRALYGTTVDFLTPDSERETIGDGTFRGAGSTERWKPAYRPKDAANFNEAYDEAKAAGAETFWFGDKLYNTLSEANPIREFNNRFVGAGRTEEMIRQRGVYGKDFGPLRGPLADFPIIHYAFGGQLGTNGTDWTNGLMYIDNGGRHEDNPLEGVPVGFDPEGVPNLVEEGETIWNDYVFSDRIKVPKEAMKEFGLGGSLKKDITFAEASKILGKESEQRPNDTISIDGLNEAMNKLAMIQEAERMKQQMKDYVGLAQYACGGKVNKFSGNDTWTQWMDNEEPKWEENTWQLTPLQIIARNKSTKGRTITVGDNGTSLRSTPKQSSVETLDIKGTRKDKAEKVNIPKYATWMRYTPVFGAGAMTLTDALGLTNNADYSYADKLESAAESAGYVPNIRPEYIGDYMEYVPVDPWFSEAPILANSRALSRDVLNTGANQAAKMAGLLALTSKTNTALGEAGLSGQLQNFERKYKAKDFNRKTNMFNSQLGLEADMANARYRQQAGQQRMSGLAQAAGLRETIDARTNAARTANFSNFLTSLGNIGRENMAFNMVNGSSAANNGYWIDEDGNIHYIKKPKD